MRFYIASKLENAERVKALGQALQALGWTWTYDWTAHGSVQGESEIRIREVALAETRGVETADIVFALLPGGRGTHVEIGMALALEKPLVLHAEDPSIFAFPEAPIFYRHPGVARHACEFECFLALLSLMRDEAETPEKTPNISGAQDIVIGAKVKTPKGLGRVTTVYPCAVVVEVWGERIMFPRDSVSLEATA